MTKVIEITSVRNAHGCKVKRRCASCQNMCIKSDGTRVCALTMMNVPKTFDCKEWQMSEGLMNAGKSGGKVKRKEYLMFVQDVRSAENDDIQSGKITEQERKSLEEIRQMFTEKYGSIYAIE